MLMIRKDRNFLFGKEEEMETRELVGIVIFSSIPGVWWRVCWWWDLRWETLLGATFNMHVTGKRRAEILAWGKKSVWRHRPITRTTLPTRLAMAHLNTFNILIIIQLPFPFTDFDKRLIIGCDVFYKIRKNGYCQGIPRCAFAVRRGTDGRVESSTPAKKSPAREIK